jgi:hypothetical protein
MFHWAYWEVQWQVLMFSSRGQHGECVITFNTAPPQLLVDAPLQTGVSDDAAPHFSIAVKTFLKKYLG